MGKEDTDAHSFVEHQSKRLMSLAMYHKLKSIVDSWRNEEHGKARVAAGALYGLVVWFAVLAASAFVLPVSLGLVLLIGFLAWISLVVWLIRKNLRGSR